MSTVAGDQTYFSDDAAISALVGRINSLTGERVLIAVAGAPGSGKSTLAEYLVAQVTDAVLVPMDGFHLDNTILQNRKLLHRKGATETFDAAGFASLVQRLAIPGAEVFFPVFDRDRDLAISGAGLVSPQHRIVVLEGNYLLSQRKPWVDIRYDLTVFLHVPEPILRTRLTARWERLGADAAGVSDHLANDLANAQMIVQTSRDAQINVTASTGAA